MTELDLYKFFHNKEEPCPQYSFDGEKAIAWIYHFNVEEFSKLIKSSLLDDGGIEVRLQEHHIAIDMTEVCEYFGIDPNKVFTKTN